MMTMRSKYVNGMNEIKADDQLKESIRRKWISNPTPEIRVRLFRHKVALIVSSFLVVSLLTLGISLVVPNGDPSNNRSSGILNGFIITAYAEDGTPLVVTPDVEFPLGKYSMFMSNVPGFPVTISSKDADHIIVRTTEGELLLWSSPDSQVKLMGKEAAVHSGDTIYWSPLADGRPVTRSKLEITSYRDGKKRGSTAIEISSSDRVNYSGKLVNK